MSWRLGREAQFARSDRAVERKRRARHGARAKRALVDTRGTITQARGIAKNHFDVGEKPVRDEHRLGALKVRVAGHDGVACCLACSTSAFAQEREPR